MRTLSDETAASLAFRLAQARHVSVETFCREHFDLDQAKARSDLDRRLPSAHGAALARTAAVPIRSVLRLAISDEHSVSVWNRQSLTYSGPVRVCPRCLAEQLYGRRYWRTRFAAACPIHGTEMLAKCPHCNSDLPYFGDMGGIATQFWLESWPTCPSCLHTIESADSADHVLVAVSRRWIAALDGHPQRGYSANGFLQMSAAMLGRFGNVERYRRLAQLVAPNSHWPYHATTALLLRALLGSHTTVNVAYAALGMEFQPDQLANDIVV